MTMPQIVFSSHDPKRSEKVNIEINSEEAETLLFSLVLRSKQLKNPVRERETLELARRLDNIFTVALGWDAFDRVGNMAKPIKSVNAKLYDR